MIVKPKPGLKLTCLDIEIAVAGHFDFRANLIVPNVSWGLGLHECDLLICTRAGYLTEVEIKVSAADLRRDSRNWHGHKSNKLRRQYFAVPDAIVGLTQEIVGESWGIISVDNDLRARLVRPAKFNSSAGKLSDDDHRHLYELASMRIWSLKAALRSRIDRDRIKNKT